MVDALAIADDVARRYGVAVCPSVVQLCPPRTFAAALPVWDGRKLAYPDAAARKVQFKKAIWAGAVQARGGAVCPVVAARRADVMRLHAQGLSVRQISEALHVSYSVGLKDHRVCGLPPNACVTPAMTQSAVRAARVAQMHAEGWTAKRIGAVMGMADKTVRDLARERHGLRFARRVAVAGVKQPKPPKAALVTVDHLRVAADLRKAQVAVLIGQGLTLLAVAVAVGVSSQQVRRDCRDVGIGPLRAGRWREKQVAA